MLLVVEGFGGEHVTIKLCNQIGLFWVAGNLLGWIAALVIASVDKLIVCVDILQQIALAKVANAAGGASVV